MQCLITCRHTTCEGSLHNVLHSYSDIDITCTCTYYDQIGENPLIIHVHVDLAFHQKFGHFYNVLKTLHKSYQQACHFELSRTVQTILSLQLLLLRFLSAFRLLKRGFCDFYEQITQQSNMIQQN